MAFDFERNMDNAGPETLGKDMGKAVAKGLGVGLEEDSYHAITAMEKVYVELESLTKNATKNAEKLAKKQQQRKLDNLKNSLKLELVTEQEYYSRLKKFRDENLRQGTDAWYKCTEEIAAYNKKVLDEAEKEQQALIEKLVKLKNQLFEKFKGNDKWFSSSKIRFLGLGENGTDLVYSDTMLKDFQEEIRLLENYRDRITELQNLGGVPDGIFSDIGSLSIKDGLTAVDAILLASEEERKKFFSGYTMRDNVADSSAAGLLGILKAKELKDEGISTETAFVSGFSDASTGKEFAEILSGHFDNVPESYLELGKGAGNAFGEGFLAEMPQLMETIKAQFDLVIEGIAKQISVTLLPAMKAANTQNTYTTTYNFNSSKQTTTEQLNAARAASTLERLRGGSK